MQNIRCFLAIKYPCEVCKKIEAYQQFVRSFFPDRSVGWTPGNNLHLTLKFYGEITNNQVNNLKSVLQKIAYEFTPFSFIATGSGVFPNPDRARILWIGATPGEHIIHLARRVESISKSINVEQEKRPFSPHLTIGRIRDGFSRTAIESAIQAYLSQPAGDMGCVHVENLVLFRSDLHPGGAIYTPIQEFRLGK